jgi:hypothetical protein
MDSGELEKRIENGRKFLHTEWRYAIVSHKVIALDAGHVCQKRNSPCMPRPSEKSRLPTRSEPLTREAGTLRIPS